MFKEVAVDPIAVASSYKDFRYIIEKFGVPEGRLIAAFPSKWRRYVFQAAQARLKGTLDLKKVEERLRKLPPDIFLHRERPGAGCSENWLAAAVDEHRRLPFEAIIASEFVDEPGVVTVSDVDGDHPCFLPNRQRHVNRNAAAMADCCGPLLTSSRHIKLIDPHFDAGAARFRRPFLEFLRRVSAETRIDIFRSDREDAAYLVQRMEHTLRDNKPARVEVRLFIRPQGPMHNRFVLSEIGGLSFQVGLDDQDDGDRPMDLVTLLERDPWLVEWQNYQGDDSVGSWS